MCPTVKQLKVVENSSTATTKKEMLLQAGYSENTAIKPSQVLQSRGVQLLIEKAEAIGLDDELCLKRVKEAITSRNINLAINTIFNFWRVKYPAEKIAVQNNIQVNNLQTPPTREEIISVIRKYVVEHKITKEEIY